MYIEKFRRMITTESKNALIRILKNVRRKEVFEHEVTVFPGPVLH